MRRVLAVLVTVCLGILIPAVVSPLRVCVLDGSVLLPGFTTYGESPTHKDKCCTDCEDTKQGKSCCLDLKELPAAEFAKGPLVLPSIVCCEFDNHIAVPPCRVILMETSHVPATPIRRPDSPGLRRALLAIWNI